MLLPDIKHHSTTPMMRHNLSTSHTWWQLYSLNSYLKRHPTSPHSNPEHVQVASSEINYRASSHHRNMSAWLKQVQKLYTGQINLWKELPRTIKGRTQSHRTDINLIVGTIWAGNCRICAQISRISVTVGFLLLNWKADLTWRHKQNSS